MMNHSKKMKLTPLLLMLMCLPSYCLAKGQQISSQPDSTHQPSLLKKSILPASFITLSVVMNNSHFEKQLTENIRNKVGHDYHFPIDDYTQYVPIVQMYLADVLGVPAKNHWFDQSKYLFLSNLLSATVTHSIKRLVDKERPYGGPHSYPSGHTTLAFTNAAVLHHEFRDTAPLLAWSGYLLATTTGVFRIINHKHWMSDVLAGAGIGILATELVYYFEPFRNFNPIKKWKQTTLIPQLGPNQYGLSLSYQF
jgi:hypothetical protein